jgi:hypothetical protein
MSFPTYICPLKLRQSNLGFQARVGSATNAQILTAGETLEHVDFLQPETPQIRNQLCNVIDSYSNDWDMLAEL